MSSPPFGDHQLTGISQAIRLRLLGIVRIIVNFSCGRSLLQATKDILHLVVLFVLAAGFAVAEVDDGVGYEVEGDDSAIGFAHCYGALDWGYISISLHIFPSVFIKCIRNSKLTLPPMRFNTLNCAHQKVRLLLDILVHFTSIRAD